MCVFDYVVTFYRGKNWCWCFFSSLCDWKCDHLGENRFVRSAFIQATCGWLSCSYFPRAWPMLGFIHFFLIQREKEQQEGETSVIRSTVKSEASERRAMITPALREALTKQGESPQELLQYYAVECSECMHTKSLQSCLTLCDPMDCGPLGSCPWDSSGKNTGVGCHFLLQGIFPPQGSNPQLLHCRRILYRWATGEALKCSDLSLKKGNIK